MDDDGKDEQGYTLLNYFELHEREWTAIALKSYSVSWNLAAVLKECNTPREEYDTDERPVG